MLSEWSDFFVAAVGASSALAGLLFVAASINLQRILEFPHLPLLMAQTLLSFLAVTAIGSVGLTPHLSRMAMGLTLTGVALQIWLTQTMLLVRMFRLRNAHFQPLSRTMLNQMPAIPFVIAGALFAGGHEGALIWLLPGTLLNLAAGVIGAWILLIEIQR